MQVAAMARATPVEFKMYFKVDFDTIIQVHHVYKYVWTPIVDEILECVQDTRTGVKEHNENSIGVYKPLGLKGTKQPNSKKMLAGHVPIELLHLLNNFLCTNTENNLFAKVTGKFLSCTGKLYRHVPRFLAVTIELCIAEVLERES